MKYTYGDSFAHTITSTYGTKGTQWLTHLPAIIEQCTDEWGLTELKPYAHLTYNYVLSGMMQSIPIVLKLRCDHEALVKEYAALTAFSTTSRHSSNGATADGCVKVLASKPEIGAILLVRMVPGNLLASLFPNDDARATRIAAECIRTLHKVPITINYSFPSLEQTLPHFTDEPRALAPFITHARFLRKQLLSTQEKIVLLHGDFHQGNILSSGIDSWTVIDPEGIIGDPIYDIAVYIRNPLTELIETSDSKTLIGNRIHDFAALLGYNKQRIYDWTYLQAVTSAYWSIEDGLDASRHVTFLQLLKEVNL